MEPNADDGPSRAECTCILVSPGIALTGGCPMHDPFLGLLVEQPVKFCGIRVLIDPEAG